MARLTDQLIRRTIWRFVWNQTKSIEAPEELSLSKFVQFDAYYWGVIDQMLSAQVAESAGVRDAPFEGAAQSAGTIYFSNEFARSWWRHSRSN